MASLPVAPIYQLTYRNWLVLPEDGKRYEIIEGELFTTPPPNIEHQTISRELEFLLLQFLKRTRLGTLFYAPVGVRLSDEDVLEPDLVVVLSRNASRIGEQVIEGAPDLVVEILSPGTARRDLGIKRSKYQAAGVTEYWIVDPAAGYIEVLALEGGSYARQAIFRRDDVLTSALLPGLQVPLSEVFVKA